MSEHGQDRSGRGQRRAPAPQRLTSTTIDVNRGVFMISIAAELAEMHPQTLRLYEARGLIAPQRSPRNTRLYSQRDVELLRRIQELTGGMGMNLAGVEAVLRLERDLERMRDEVARMRRRADEMERQMLEEVERVRRSFRAEIVPYGAYDTSLVPAAPAKRRRIPVERRRGRIGP